MKKSNIKLRKVLKDDLTKFRDWRNSRQIWENNTQFIFLNMKNQSAWFKTLSENKLAKKMYTIVNDRNRPIGICGLIEINMENKNAKIAIIIGELKQQSKGVGTESLKLLLEIGFNDLKLHRIEAEVLEFNKRSIKFFEKFDFKKEAILNDYLFRNGKWNKLIVFSKLAN